MERATDEKPTEFIPNVVEKKEERHHIGEPRFVLASRTMVHITRYEARHRRDAQCTEDSP